jgi:hypothetical protein
MRSRPSKIECCYAESSSKLCACRISVSFSLSSCSMPSQPAREAIGAGSNNPVFLSSPTSAKGSYETNVGLLVFLSVWSVGRSVGSGRRNDALPLTPRSPFQK